MNNRPQHVPHVYVSPGKNRVKQKWKETDAKNPHQTGTEMKTNHHNHLRPFFWNHPGEMVPEESSIWILWCKGG